MSEINGLQIKYINKSKTRNKKSHIYNNIIINGVSKKYD